MAKNIKIGGVQIPVISEADAEEAHAVICGYPSDPNSFTDNVRTTCAWCGTPIIHRPHAPKKPPKVCFGWATASRQ